MTAPCVLASLKDPKIGDWLPGLVVTDGAIEIDQAWAGCCAGSGLRWDAKTNVTSSCSLAARLAAVRRLGGLFYKTWGETGQGLAATLASPKAQVAVHRMAALAAGTSDKGLAYFAGGQRSKQPTVWSLAAAAAWRFGLDAHVVTLDRGKGTAALPVIDGKAAGRSVIFVENAQRLWHTPVAEELERLVAFAYGALVPLWVEIRGAPPEAPEPGKPGASSFNVHRALSQRVAEAKTKAPLSWLGPEIRSKFLAVADAAPGISAERAKRAKAPAEPPRLPWDH